MKLSHPIPDLPKLDAFERQLTVSEPITLLAALQQLLGADFSNQQLKTLLALGCVWVAEKHSKQAKNGHKTSRPGRFRRAKKPLQPGDTVFVYYNHAVLTQTIEMPQLICDHHSFSAWYKPKGVLSQGSKWGDHTTLNRWIEMHYRFGEETDARPCWIVHRLDKATDGVMLIAHSKKMARHLSQLFEQNQVKKTYQAWVKGHFPDVEQRLEFEVNGKSALSFAKGVEYLSDIDQSLVEIRIETGRKHQIRSHLAQAGFPIIGDRLYGDADNGSPDLQLTAVKLVLQDKTLPSPHNFQWPS